VTNFYSAAILLLEQPRWSVRQPPGLWRSLNKRPRVLMLIRPVSVKNKHRSRLEEDK
jgi:hypothetical protein